MSDELERRGETTLADVIERAVGDNLTSVEKSVHLLAASQLRDLSYAINEFLEAERALTVGQTDLQADSAPIVPIVYSGWEFGWAAKGRACERLALLHDRILVPSSHCRWDSPDQLDPSPALVLQWLTRIRPLLNSRAVRIVSQRVYATRALRRACNLAADRRPTDLQLGNAHLYAPVIPQLTPAEREQTVRDHLASLYPQVFVAKRLGAKPAFAHDFVYRLWRDTLVSHGGNAIEGGDSRLSNTICSLALPGFDRLPASELVRLRADSEVLSELRVDVRNVLRDVTSDIEHGEDPSSSFADRSATLIQSAEKVRNDSPLGKLCAASKSAPSTFVIGAASLVAAKPLIEYFGETPTTVKDLIKLAPGVAAPFLWRLLFYRPKPGARAAVRVYQALTNSPRDGLD